LFEDKFTKPVDSFTNCFVVTLTLFSVNSTKFFAWNLIFGYCLAVMLFSAVSIFFGDRFNEGSKAKKVIDTCFYLSRYLGKATKIFSFVFLCALVSFYSLTSDESKLLLIFWGAVMLIEPFKIPALLARIFSKEKDDFVEDADINVIEEAFKRAGRLFSSDLTRTFSEHLASEMAEAEIDEESLIEAHVDVAALGLVEEVVEFVEYEADKLSRDWFNKYRVDIRSLNPHFDMMRLYYVALSRAKNELIIANFRSRGNYINDEFKELIAESMCAPLHSHLVTEMPHAKIEEATFTKTYSYTADYQFYDLCPRQYMIFRAYDFCPSRTQGMFFGDLVHQTIEDLHNYLIAKREDEEDAA